ncbi:hypothetical protein ACTPEF_26690, partial [Clostridioides difficile]
AVTSNAIAVINSLDKLKKIEFEKVVGEEGHIECIVKDTHVKDANNCKFMFNIWSHPLLF